MKDSNEQLNKEILRVKSRGSLSAEPLSCVIGGEGAPPSQLMELFTNPELSESCCLGAFIEVALDRHAWLKIGHWWLNSISSASPLPGSLGGGTEIAKFLTKPLSFWWTIPIWSYSGGPRTRYLISMQKVLITQEIPRGLGAVCLNPAQTPNDYLLWYHSLIGKGPGKVGLAWESLGEDTICGWT